MTTPPVTTPSTPLVLAIENSETHARAQRLAASLLGEPNLVSRVAQQMAADYQTFYRRSPVGWRALENEWRVRLGQLGA